MEGEIGVGNEGGGNRGGEWKGKYGWGMREGVGWGL